MSLPLRRPYEESTDLYPGLVVHDGRVTGSITTGRSRLPLWAFVGLFPEGGWEATADYDPEEYGWTARHMGAFLYHLFEHRGELARLLLVLADVERRAIDREHDEVGRHFAEAHPGEHVCECGHEGPPPWWADVELRGRVADQLRRCLDALEDTP